MCFKEFMKKRWFMVLIALVILSGGIFAAVSFLGGQDKEAAKDREEEPKATMDADTPGERIRLDLAALLSDKAGVKTESGFKLTFPKGVKLDPKAVTEGLKIAPNLEYDLEGDTEGFIIKPRTFLAANQVYTFKLDLPEQNIKESWAFQTRREFKVISSLPGSKATNVPLNTGIEITFSHTDVVGFEKNFTIQPQVDGRFEMHKNIGVFIPKTLEPDTVYTVTVGKGVTQADSNESLKEDYTFAFQTQTDIQAENRDESYFSIYEWLHNFPSDSQPILETGASKDFRNKNIELAVYRYDDADAFIRDYDAKNEKPDWATIEKKRYLPDVSRLSLFKSYTQPIAFPADNDYLAYLALPENLPEGHYLLVAKSGELMDYAFIQINDMQLYLGIGDDKSVVWVNDMLSGQPVKDVLFEGNGIKPVSTVSDGTGQISEDIFKNREGRTICFTASREGHPKLLVPVYNGSHYWESWSRGVDRKSNWNSLYLDRSHYLPTDSVKLWGILRPRDGSTPPEKVTVNLVRYLYDYSTYTNNKQVLESRAASLTPTGTYSAEFSFENLPDEGYEIEVVHGDKIVSSSFFYVSKYVKSQYVVSLNPEHKAYFSGETLNAQAGCEFFEGTPVSGYEMEYHVRNYNDYPDISSGSLTIDNQGKADISVVLPEDPSRMMSWKPVYHQLDISNKNPEDTQIYRHEYFYVFPRDVMADTEIDFNNGTANVKFKTNAIDLGQVREKGEFYDGGEDPLYKGAPIDLKIGVTLYERYWDRKETGEYYDIISKQNLKTYDYFEVKNPIDTFEVQTTGGMGSCSISIPDYSVHKLYTIEYETVDTKNRPIREEDYLTDYDDYWYGYGYEGAYYHLDFADIDSSYKVGEPIDFTLKKNNNETVSPGNILYMVLKDGIQSYWTSPDINQSIVFADTFIPNIFIQAVYFDGRELHTAYERLVRFDYGDKKLDMALTTDKESYSPGETVHAVLSVRDISGKPVEADVNLSVVDEAYFALFDQEADILQSLYSSVYEGGIRFTYVSYNPIRPMGDGAEGGEGEDEGGRDTVRRNFVDNAFFTCARTDKDGQASISFQLPDNLTSWRMTYQAFTGDLKAGSGQNNIKVRLPFFVKTVANDIYMAGDAPRLLVKGYGEGVEPGDEVTYTLALRDINGKRQDLEGKGKAGEYTEIALPPLEEGTYTLTLKGQTADFEDAVENTFQVRKNLLLAKQVDYYTLAENLKLEGIEGYAVLRFFNADLNDYYRCLEQLYWSYGNRLDQVMAGNVSRELLKQYFADGSYAYGDEADITPYQKEDGGFALFPYGSSEVELSAKMAVLCSGKIDTLSLSRYFHSIIDDPTTTPLQVSAAYFGLASLHEPVLLELQGFMEQGGMTLDENLYLANALAVLGDFGNAQKLYDNISGSSGKDLKPYRYIDNEGDKDDILRWTSLMAILAVNLDAEDKMAYFKYVEQNSPDESLINMERMILVKQGLPHVSKESSFILEVDGKKETVRLEGTEPKMIMLSKDKIKTLRFSEIKGAVSVSVSYEKAQSPSVDKNQAVTVKRIYNNSTDTPVAINRTDLVEIKLDIAFSEAAPEGYYEVTDILPSGLRYVYPYQANVDEWYFGRPDGQRVKLGVYYNGKNQNVRISYYARVSSPGEYTADCAMVKHSESDACGYSEKTQVQIR